MNQDETYHASLRRQITEAEGKLEKINHVINERFKYLNKINNISASGKKAIDDFLEQELNSALKIIKEAKIKARDELRNNVEFFESIKKRELDIREREINIEKQEKEIKSLRESVAEQSSRARIANLDLSNFLTKADAVLFKIKFNQDFSYKSRQEASQILRDAVSQSKKIMQFAKEKGILLEKREAVVVSKEANLALRENVLKDEKKWVEDQREDINSQWAALESAKKYLDERST